MGLTLLELLVVVAIIGILAALIFPVLGKLQTRAERIECASRLRALGAAINLYVNDNNNQFPTSGLAGAGEDPIPVPSRERWYVKVAPYLDGPQVSKAGWDSNDPARLLGSGFFRCPFCDHFLSGVGVYGLHAALCYERHPVSRSEVSRPSRFPLLACLGGLDTNGEHRGGMHLDTQNGPHIMARQYGWTGTVSGNGPSPNHDGICNFLFADGHVEGFPVSEEDSWPWTDPHAFDL